jgi:protein ImuB
VLDEHRRTVTITPRGLLSAPPELIGVDSATPVVIEAWAGPWPIDELWWDPARARQVARFQVVGVDGSAWLMVVEDGCWWAEARYD